MDKVQVKMLQAFSTWNEGQVVETRADVAVRLVQELKVAEYVTEETTPKTTTDETTPKTKKKGKAMKGYANKMITDEETK